MIDDDEKIYALVCARLGLRGAESDFQPETVPRGLFDRDREKAKRHRNGWAHLAGTPPARPAACPAAAAQSPMIKRATLGASGHTVAIHV